jgi:hypothetical protein
VTKGLIHPVKIHDEVIAREIIINDADPGVWCKLTKLQTQEEIQAKTGAVVITRGRFRPPNEPPDSEKPLYLHISAGVQDPTERIKSVDAAAALVEEMMKQGLPSAGTVQNGGGGPPLSLVANVGFFADPSFNLVGRIRGPNVSTGALCLIVTRLLWTLVLYLERLVFISKDSWFCCHMSCVWHSICMCLNPLLLCSSFTSSPHPLCFGLFESLVKSVYKDYNFMHCQIA